MKELLNARFFSWLEECSGKDVTKDEVELVVGEFVADLERMCDKEKNYKEEVRVLERVYIYFFSQRYLPNRNASLY